jgi:hypothetical protein
MHTCLDQYNANKATNANGGMRWIERGGGYYSECNRRLKANSLGDHHPVTARTGISFLRQASLA